MVDQSDGANEAVERLAADNPDGIAYHRVGFRGLPQARNYGWTNAKHDAIVFVDDDVRCGPDLVSEHLRALLKPGVGLVAGGIDAPGGVERSAAASGSVSPLDGHAAPRFRGGRRIRRRPCRGLQLFLLALRRPPWVAWTKG